MTRAKVAVTLDVGLLHEIDRRVSAGQFASRSQAIRTAVAQLLDSERQQQQLLGELVKLNVAEERALANEELAADVPWPTY